MTHGRFRDRRDAGHRLADRLAAYAARPGLIVLGLPRGGIPVAYEVAEALRAPLDVFTVRKLGVPGQEELAMGAIASGGTRVINDEIVDLLRIPDSVVLAIAEREQRELDRREVLYRGRREPLAVAGTTVIVIDDGMATGSSMLAAVEALRRLGPARIVVAVPVAARVVAERLREDVDELICVIETDALDGVSLWYDDFHQTSDAEVRGLLENATWRDTPAPAASPPSSEPAQERVVEIAAGDAIVAADLAVPAAARGLVIFAHGSGSSRMSPRNRQVARHLQNSGLATLLLDLLTAEEGRLDEQTRELRFDIGLLADRLAAATGWAADQPALRGLATGYFGASTGAAAALVAAARRPHVAAVVSRGGRPDLAGESLAHVRCPTLLIVGGRDFQVLDLNRAALRALAGTKQLEVVPGATHLFEEPGALDEVCRLAADWFLLHLRRAAGERETR